MVLTMTSPLWDVDAHPQHLLLEVVLVVAQSAPEEEEAGALSLMLTHKHKQEVRDNDRRVKPDHLLSGPTCTQSLWNQLPWQDGHLRTE